MPDNKSIGETLPSATPRAQVDVEALPAGSRVAEFEVQRVLGRGGFGIVYLAMDHLLRRQVAIKEYLPAALAGRGENGHLALRSSTFADTFEAGLRSFVNEARLLARFDHPALVKVHRYWEANGTAYMVMPYYKGATLQQVRQSMTDAPDEAWLRRILDALLGALDVMHADSVYHRDVAPDNIVLLSSGLPALLDFGAARHVLAGQAQVITAMIKPAYAPIEQYADPSEFTQGPWTDVYGTAATLHYCLIGKPPPTAAARTVQDTYQPLADRRELLEPTKGTAYSRSWLAALDWGLAVKPQDRPQTIARWKDALSGKLPAPASTVRLGPITTPAAQAEDTHFPTTTRQERPARAPDEQIEIQAPVLRPASAPRRGAAPWALAALMTAIVAGVGLQMLPPSQTPVARTQVASEPVPAPTRVTEPRSATQTTVAAVPARLPPTVTTPIQAGEDAGFDSVVARLTSPLPEPNAQVPKKRVPNKARPRAQPTLAAEFDKPSARNGVSVITAVPQLTSNRINGPVSPREACSHRGVLGTLRCMNENCASRIWSQHPQCITWREMERRHVTSTMY